jgi:hypothetical protein
MKKIMQVLMLGLVAAMLLAVPALAQTPSASPAAAPAQDDTEAKAAQYKKFTEIYKTDPATAYGIAKDYVEKYPNDDPQIINYLKTFIGKYEKFSRQQAFDKAFTEGRWPDVFTLGKPIVAEKPDDLTTNLKMAWAGLKMAQANNSANNADAMNFSQKTLQLIESGKTPDDKPYIEKDKQEQLGWLNYSLYLYNTKNNKQDDALNYLVKSAQIESPIKTNPDTYIKLASIYENNYDKMRQDYTAKYPDGSEETPEKKAALETVKQSLDPLIDALARTIAYLGTDPKTQQSRDELKKSLTDYYKYRHGSEEGLDALIANIKTKPLPKPGEAGMTTSTTTMPDANTASGTKAGATTPAAATATPATKTPTTNTTPANTKTPASSTKPAGKSPTKSSKKTGTARPRRG